METISDQIESVKDRFKTKKVFDKTSRISLTNDEIEGIIYILKNERKDGIYAINDELNVVLKNGTCSIVDNHE